MNQSPALSRRAFLGGGAVAVSLPFLESMLPREARAQTAATPKRLIYYYVPNGINMAGFRPAAAGAGYATPSMLVPLEPLKADFSVITGLENAPGKPDDQGDHASGTASFITGVHAFKSETEIMLGISADQVAANQIGTMTRIKSLQLGMQAGSTAGNCDSGYSCAYARNISWSGPTTPLPKLTDPAKIFDEIFKGTSVTDSDAAAAKRRAYNKSVLDLVTADATRLTAKLGRTDANKLQEYLTGVRELERQIAGTSTTTATCAPGVRPVASTDFSTKVKQMADLMVLAFQCDATRIITFMLGNALSNQTYPALGITRGHHDISHHANDVANIDMLQTIGLWEMEQFAYLLTKMKGITEGTSNMLYNSAVFLSSDISDGNRHNHDDLPVLLAGHGGGALHPGKHVVYAKTAKQKISNLLLSTLATVGVTGMMLGDGTGPLPEV